MCHQPWQYAREEAFNIWKKQQLINGHEDWSLQVDRSSGTLYFWGNRWIRACFQESDTVLSHSTHIKEIGDSPTDWADQQPFTPFSMARLSLWLRLFKVCVGGLNALWKQLLCRLPSSKRKVSVSSVKETRWNHFTGNRLPSKPEACQRAGLINLTCFYYPK